MKIGISNKRALAVQSGLLLLVVTAVFSFQNCANNYKLSSTGGASANGAAGSSSTAVCDPFNSGSAGSTSSQNGLAASALYYLEPGQDPSVVTNYSSLVSNALGIENIDLIFSSINVPSLYFNSGFTNNAGSVLTASDGSTLIEYFGFTATGYFVLGNWAAGDYDLATMTDDGSILTLTGGVQNGDGTTSDLVVNSDDFQAMRLECSTNSVHLDANSKIPLSFSYFQGPRYHMGMLVLARPHKATDAKTAACGKVVGADYYFADSNPPGTTTPTAAYNAILADGWAVVDASHYILPANLAAANPCAATH